MTRSRPVSRAVLLLTAASIGATTLAACGGGPSGGEIKTAKRAAALCGNRALGLPAGADQPTAELTGDQAIKPIYAAIVVGVAGDPPTALGYDLGNGKLLYVVVPAATAPGRGTTLADAISSDTGAAATGTIPQARRAVIERCFGGSAPG